MTINNKQKNKGFTRTLKLVSGFTLIELMVATTLFVVIMLTAMSSLFMLLDESKSSRALRLAMDNVNFAMDSMTRSIRMGTDYTSTNGTFISFNSQDSKNIKYQWVTLSNGKTIEKCVNNSDCVSIISPDVNIDTLNFSLNSSGTQPSVYIIMKGTVKVKGVPTSFAIQTMASQRNF